MKCSRCNGRKYIELDKIGLVSTTCPECKGTGEEVEDNKIIESHGTKKPTSKRKARKKKE